MEFKEVFKGIDSLYVSYRGLLKERLKEYLEEKKELAQSDDEIEQAIRLLPGRQVADIRGRAAAAATGGEWG